MQVPDPAATADFFVEAFDLVPVPDDGTVHLTADGPYGAGPPPRMLSLTPGDALRLDRLGFELHDHADVESLASHLRAAADGVELLFAHDRLREGVCFIDPHGFLVECRRRATPLDGPLAVSGIRPRRLGHVNLKVADAGAAARFYERALGLRLSEQVGQMLYFLRVGSDHHNLGFRGGAEVPAVHHVAFEIIGWDTYRTVCDRIADMGHVAEYGPGRHGPGHNLFVYVVEPSSGLRLELFSDMAHIDDDAFEPIVWESVDRSRTVNVWGPQPPTSFLE